MAEINKGEIVDSGAIQEILDLKKSIDDASTSLKALVKTGKEAGVHIKGAESTKQLRDETEKLTLAQAELQKIEKQIEVVNARASKAYQDQQTALKNLKKEQNERLILGAKNAKQVNEQNSSITQLIAALNKNRAAYKALSDEEARNSKEGKELKAVIDQQDAAVKRLNGGLGDFKDNVGNYETSIKGLKTELKATKEEMAKLAATSGTTSKEFLEASEKAGELKDKLDEINDAIKNTSQSKFENISTSLKDVGSKLLNMDFEGAATSAKQFASAMKSLSFDDIINGIKSFGSAIATVGKAILTNPIFIIAGIIAGVGLAFKYFVDQQEKASARAIERYKKEEEALLSRYDTEIQLQKIVGKQTFELEKERQRIIIASSKQQEEEITKRKKGIQDLLKAGLDLAQANKFADEAEKILSDEKKKQLEELRKARRDALNQIKILEAEQSEFEKKTSADSLKQRKDDIFNLAKFRLQVQAEAQEEIAKNEEIYFNDRANALKKANSLKDRIAKLEYDKALDQENLTNEAITLIKEEYQKKLLDNKQQASNDEQKINEDITKREREEYIRREKEEKDRLDKANKERIRISKEAIEREYMVANDALNSRINLIKQEVIDGKKTREEGEKEIIALQKSLGDEYIQLQIDRAEKILLIEGITAEERLAIEKELLKLKGELTDAYYKQIESKEVNNIEKIKKYADTVVGIYQNFSDAVGEIFKSNYENRVAKLDADEQKNKEKTERELALAGDNEAEKNRIMLESEKNEKAINDRRRKEQIKYAKQEKTLASFSAGISAALAVLNALSTVKPYPLAVIAAVSAGILGAAQVVAIQNKPLPQFYKGGIAPGGDIIAGELGTELMVSPSGRIGFTPSHATVMDVEKGTKIFDHGKTMRMLALAGLGTQEVAGKKEDAFNQIVAKKLDTLNDTIKGSTPRQIDYYNLGLAVYRAEKVNDTFTRHSRERNLGKWVK